MHIPSKRVYDEMRSEAASLWVVPANGGEELATLLKAPSSSIKALFAGCPISIILGLKGKHLAAGARVYDMPDAPILISGAVRHTEEHEAIRRLLEEGSAPIFLFNEMDVCLGWTNLTLAPDEVSRAKALINQISELYSGPFNADSSHALDCFDFSLDNSLTHPGAVEIPTVELHLGFEPWRVTSASFIGIRGYETIDINDKNEGEMFERAVWASMVSVFPLTLYKSPQVKIGKHEREFTDVLAFYPYGSFLIEAKDLSVIGAGYARDQIRRTSGVQKQIKKAIGQLVGACKAMTRGDEVIDDKRKALDLVRDKPPHCIVLITELMHWGEWSEIEELLTQAMKTTGGFFHLMDLREFIVLLKGSRGEPELFDFNLMERRKMFVTHNSVFVRTLLSAPPDFNGKSAEAGAEASGRDT